MTADPNLDLGLDYTGGITKPTLDQAGHVARVTADGLNLEYVPASIIAGGSSLVFTTAQARIDAVASAPGWTIIGAFWLPADVTTSLELIGAVSDASLTMTVKLYCVTSPGDVTGSSAVITSTTDMRVLSSSFTLAGSKLYQVWGQVVGNAGSTYYGTARRTSPYGTIDSSGGSGGSGGGSGGSGITTDSGSSITTDSGDSVTFG